MMKARSVKTPRVYTGKMAQIMARIGAAKEIGNSANLTKETKQDKEVIIEEPIEQVEEMTIVEEVTQVEEIIEKPVKGKKGRKLKK